MFCCSVLWHAPRTRGNASRLLSLPPSLPLIPSHSRSQHKADVYLRRVAAVLSWFPPRIHKGERKNAAVGSHPECLLRTGRCVFAPLHVLRANCSPYACWIHYCHRCHFTSPFPLYPSSSSSALKFSSLVLSHLWFAIYPTKSSFCRW